MQFRSIVYLSIGAILLGAMMFGTYCVYHRYRYGDELTVRNDTDTEVMVRPEFDGDTTFGGIVAAHSTGTIDSAVPFGHPNVVYIVVRGGSIQPGYSERCSWTAAKRHQPLVVTNDGAGCGERTLDQPISPLQ